MYEPNSKLTRVVDAAVEPLGLAAAKRYLRLSESNCREDADIADMITAARLECERIGDRSYITTSWRLTLDYLPMSAGPFAGLPWPMVSYGGVASGGGFNRINAHDGGITLPMPPLIALTSLTYLDQGGNTRSLDVSAESTQVIVSPGKPGRIYPAFATFFPLSQPRAAAVNIDYTAGYGPDPSDVPRNIVMAMRLLVSHYYEHRTTNAETPDAVANLIVSTEGWGYA